MIYSFIFAHFDSPPWRGWGWVFPFSVRKKIWSFAFVLTRTGFVCYLLIPGLHSLRSFTPGYQYVAPTGLFLYQNHFQISQPVAD